MFTDIFTVKYSKNSKYADFSAVITLEFFQELFFNIINVTFDQFNVSLVNKSFLKKENGWMTFSKKYVGKYFCLFWCIQ